MNFKMKNIRLLATIAGIAGAIAITNGQNSINNPMTRAVIDAYTQQIKADPTSYELLFKRANEYYRHGEYMRAAADIDNALRYIPTKDMDMRTSALLLRANINTQTGRPAQALDDLNTIVALDPDNYVAVYQRANALYTLERYAEAATDYKRLQRLNPRSSEALVGLARVAVKQDNLGLANEYLETAVNADPSNASLYVRRASVRRDMGNDQGAVADLIVALATDPRNVRATQMLVDYGKDNYGAVVAGLSEAMRQAPNVGMYPYLRAVIAQAGYHYGAALKDYSLIVEQNLYNYHGIYRAMAECLYCMGRYDEALENVNRALEMDPNSADAAILRARVLRALGLYEDSRAQAAKAVYISGDKPGALAQLGLACVSLEDYAQAGDLFAETTLEMDAGSQAQWYYLLRAWVLGTYLHQETAAAGFYEKISEIGTELGGVNPVAAAYGAFGDAYAGRTVAADNTMATLTAENPDNALLQYLGACYYAQTGNSDAALACAERALKSGYANYHDWNMNTDARVNTAPLRDDLRYLNLLTRYAYLWE